MPTPIAYVLTADQVPAIAVLLLELRRSRDLWPLREPVPTAQLVMRLPPDATSPVLLVASQPLWPDNEVSPDVAA